MMSEDENNIIRECTSKLFNNKRDIRTSTGGSADAGPNAKLCEAIDNLIARLNSAVFKLAATFFIVRIIYNYIY